MPWFIGRTKPCSEHIAQRQIERHFGVLTAPQWNKARHTYLPMFFDLRNRRRQCLFTSWLFIRETHAFQFLFHIEALSFLLMSDDRPATLADRHIGEWRRREDKRGLVRIPPKDFRKGEQVKVLYGPMQDQLAIYQGMSGAERVSVLMQLLGKETRATIDVHALDHA
jgi:hypothetical protein